MRVLRWWLVGSFDFEWRDYGKALPRPGGVATGLLELGVGLCAREAQQQQQGEADRKCIATGRTKRFRTGKMPGVGGQFAADERGVHHATLAQFAAPRKFAAGVMPVVVANLVQGRSRAVAVRRLRKRGGAPGYSSPRGRLRRTVHALTTKPETA